MVLGRNPQLLALLGQPCVQRLERRRAHHLACDEFLTSGVAPRRILTGG